MRSIFTPQDWQRLLDWGVICALGGGFLLLLALILGLAVRVFLAAGGV